MTMVVLAAGVWLSIISVLSGSSGWLLAAVVTLTASTVLLFGRLAGVVLVVACLSAAAMASMARHAVTTNPIAITATPGAVTAGVATLTESSRASTFGGWWATAQLEAAGGRGPVVVYGSGDRLERGSRLVGDFRLKPSGRGGYVAEVTVIGDPQIRGPTAWPDLFQAHWLRWIADLPGGWSSDERALLAGLTVGADHNLSDEGRDIMQSAGLGHLTAVSGSNCGLILLGSVWLLSPVVASRRARLGIGWLMLAGYVAVVGAQPSVLRAALMWTLVTAAWLIGGRRATWHVVSMTVICLLLVDPWLARSLGFALSVAATAGLAALWNDRAPVSSLIRATLAAQAATAPLLLANGLPLGVVTVLANAVVGPFVALVTTSGIAVTVVRGLGPGHEWLSAIPLAPVRVMLLLAQWARRVGPGSMSWVDGVEGGLVAAVVVVAVFVVGTQTRLLAVCLVVVAVTVSVAGDRADGWPPADWAVVACDVGQGDAFVVRQADTVIVVDVGPEPELIDGCLGRLRVRQIDLLVLTHFHADHVAGLSGLLRGRSVAMALVPTLEDPAVPAAVALRELHRAGVARVHPQVGQTMQWPGIVMQVLWPSRIIGSGSEPNNASICARIVTDTSSVLLLGDIETEAQRAVMAMWPDLRSEVVKVPHHGSAKAIADLPRAVQADVALVGVGQDNSFGHPAPNTVRAWAESGAEVFTTADNGDVVVTADGTVHSGG